MFKYFKDLPSFIVNDEQELEFVRKQVEHGASAIVDKINEFASEVEASTRNVLQKHLDKKKELEETDSHLSKEIQKTVALATNLLIIKDELEVKCKAEKQALLEETENVPDDETLRKLCEEATLLEQDIQEHKKNMKEKYVGFKRAVSFYKKYLGCKIIQAEAGVILFDFAHYGSLKSEKPEFYVELQTFDERKTWKLIGMNPDLECREKLAKRLEETNDTQGLLAYVRQLYKPLMDKRMVENNENISVANKT